MHIYAHVVTTRDFIKKKKEYLDKHVLIFGRNVLLKLVAVRNSIRNLVVTNIAQDLTP